MLTRYVSKGLCHSWVMFKLKVIGRGRLVRNLLQCYSCSHSPRLQESRGTKARGAHANDPANRRVRVHKMIILGCLLLFKRSCRVIRGSRSLARMVEVVANRLSI